MKSRWRIYDIPTRPKRIQYSAANIGKGIEANTAPNFPTDDGRKRKKKLQVSGTIFSSL